MIRPRPGTIPWRFLALVVVGLSAVLWLGRPAPAQRPPGPISGKIPFAQQTDIFRGLLFEKRFTPIEPPKNADLGTVLQDIDPKDTIVVWLGATDAPVSANLIPFLDKGGAVLLATDLGLNRISLEPDLAKRTGFTVERAHFIYAGRNTWMYCYNNVAQCPVLQPVPNASPNLFRNPTGVNAPPLRVATNVPACLVAQQPKPTGKVLAQLPPGCVNDQNPFARPPNPSFMLAWQSPKGGRLLLLADHSIFINEMMFPSDNGNVEFTANCMDWLSEDGKRRKVLFVEDGDVNPTFDVPVEAAPPPSQPRFDPPPDFDQKALQGLDTAIDQADSRLLEAEQEDWFNGLIHRLVTQFWDTPWHAAGILLVVLTLVGLVAGFARLVVHGFQQQNPMAPSLARLVERQEPTDSLMEQRNQALFQVRNFFEVGRQLARQTFEAAGLAAKAGDPLPPVAVKGSWWQRRKLRRQVARLWALAFGTKPVPVTPAVWPTLLRELKDLRAALATGSVRLG
jgi:hypothetical protein